MSYSNNINIRLTRKITFLVSLVLASFILLALASTSSAATLSNETTLSRWAYTANIVKVHARPDSKGKVITRTRWRTEDGLPELYLALYSKVVKGEEYVKVRLPRRPNNSTGWIPRNALGPWHKVRTQLVINKRAYRATLYKGNKRVWSGRIGIGKSGTPTPTGNFYVREKLKGFGNPIYGPYVFALSAYAPYLTDWPGGGIIGIHGTNQPGILPGQVSHGCIRLPNYQISKLWRKMPLGTPVLIM